MFLCPPVCPRKLACVYHMIQSTHGPFLLDGFSHWESWRRQIGNQRGERPRYFFHASSLLWANFVNHYIPPLLKCSAAVLPPWFKHPALSRTVFLPLVPLAFTTSNSSPLLLVSRCLIPVDCTLCPPSSC